MKAKFINEIVKGQKSGISAIGLGKDFMNKGYYKMIKFYYFG
jgi:hypothetical protein